MREAIRILIESPIYWRLNNRQRLQAVKYMMKALNQ